MRYRSIILILIALLLAISSCSGKKSYKDEIENIILDGTWKGSVSGMSVSVMVKGNTFAVYVDDTLLLETGIYNYVQNTTGGQMVFYKFEEISLKDPSSRETLYYIDEMYVRGLYYDRETHTEDIYPLSLSLTLDSENHMQNYSVILSKEN
jgi:hypothetical protein